MKVYVSSICWRNYEHNFVASLAALLKRYPGVAFNPFAGDALVERARSMVATHFLEQTEADVLLTIDSDIGFDPDDAMLLCEQAVEHDIVCAAYSGRKLGHAKPLCDLWPNTEIVFADDPTPVPIKYGASGFMATHRRVFEKMAQRPDMELCYPDRAIAFRPFYHTKMVDDSEAGHLLLSEDFAFCAYAREEGFETYLNPAVRLTHQGTHLFRLEDMGLTPFEPSPVKVTREANDYEVAIGRQRPSPESNGQGALTTA